ncbi:MAG: heparin lyase I family protein [Burkholderiales bacterium]
MAGATARAYLTHCGSPSAPARMHLYRLVAQPLDAVPLFVLCSSMVGVPFPPGAERKVPPPSSFTHYGRILRKRVISNMSSFRNIVLDVSILVTVSACGGGEDAGSGPPVLPDPSARNFFATFGSSPLRTAPGTGPSDDGVWWVEQKEGTTRATIVNVGRDGTTGVHLHTEPGDINVENSGSDGERNDLALPEPSTGCQPGVEQIWEHSVLFPDDFVSSPPGWYTVFNFHNHSGSEGGQANFHIDLGNNNLFFRGYGGKLGFTGDYPNQYGALAGPIVKNQWYDFVYHVKWSSGSDGFFKAWVNGAQKLNHSGPTLYEELNGTTLGCFLKLANYHAAFGQPTSVIHDRVIRYDVVH